MFQSACGELESRGFTLHEPGVAVAVEDAVAEEVVEGGVPPGALGVVVEARAEDVLEVLGVACHGVEPLPARQEGEGDDARLVGGGGASGAEVGGDPVMDTVAVVEKLREAAEEGEGCWTG